MRSTERSGHSLSINPSSLPIHASSHEKENSSSGNNIVLQYLRTYPCFHRFMEYRKTYGPKTPLRLIHYILIAIVTVGFLWLTYIILQYIRPSDRYTTWLSWFRKHNRPYYSVCPLPSHAPVPEFLFDIHTVTPPAPRRIMTTMNLDQDNSNPTDDGASEDKLPNENSNNEDSSTSKGFVSSSSSSLTTTTIGGGTTFNRIGSGRSSRTPPIPNIIHFIFGLKDPNAEFTFFNYAAIASVLHIQKPERILFHCFYEPQGFFWNLVKPFVEIKRTPMFDTIFGNPISHYAHKADVVRLEALLEYGGIYLDIDVITLRPFDSLMNYDMVMGQEGENGRIGLCNAVILASKDSSFLHKWYNAYRTFNSSQWNYHSVILPGIMANEYPDLIHIEAATTFFWPLWDKAGLDVMFTSNTYDYKDAIAIHTWDTAAKREGHSTNFSMQWTYECRSTLLNILQTYVPTPLFTVIMPCYNQRQYILESIETVLAQKFRSWELIIIDDTSPDSCGSFIEEWYYNTYGVSISNAYSVNHGIENRDPPQIRVLYNKVNLGLAESRNVGIRQARGHIICALDADDKIGPDYFAEAQAMLSRDPTLSLFYSDQQFFGESNWYWDVPTWDLLTSLSRGPLPVMSLYWRSLWSAVGGYSSSLPRGNEDYDFWLKLVEVGAKGYKLSGVHTYYRYKEKSMMRDGLSLRSEELSMMHIRHPQLFHPSVLLVDHNVVSSMANVTYDIIARRLSTNHVFHEDDILTIQLWMTLYNLRHGHLDESRQLLEAMKERLGSSLVHPRIGWQHEYLWIQQLCNEGNYEDGMNHYDQLLEKVPSLNNIATVVHQRTFCQPVVTRMEEQLEEEEGSEETSSFN